MVTVCQQTWRHLTKITFNNTAVRTSNNRNRCFFVRTTKGKAAPVRAIKHTGEGRRIKLHLFLTSTLHWGKWSTSISSEWFTPGLKHLRYLTQEAGGIHSQSRRTFRKRKFLTPAGNREPDRPARVPVTTVRRLRSAVDKQQKNTVGHRALPFHCRLPDKRARVVRLYEGWGLGAGGCLWRQTRWKITKNVTVSIPMCLKIRYKDYISQTHSIYFSC